jgi:hypothetical protein
VQYSFVKASRFLTSSTLAHRKESHVNTPIFFLLRNSRASDLPRHSNEYWDWLTVNHSLDESWGRYHWTLLTYLHLKDTALAPRIVDSPPEEGIVVCHRDDMPKRAEVSDRQTWVCLLVDRPSPALHAHFHVFHNPLQRLIYTSNHVYIPPWVQSSLIARDPGRGSSFERLGFFGYAVNLHQTLREEPFVAALASRGVKLVSVEPQAWHNFSAIDAVLGIRSFGIDEPHHRKPALKLMNAWAAGVPAILGYESACRAVGHPGVDYLEARTSAELLETVDRLRLNPSLVQQIVARGHLHAANYAVDRTVSRWEEFLGCRVARYHEALCGSPGRRWAHAGKIDLLERLAWRLPAISRTT